MSAQHLDQTRLLAADAAARQEALNPSRSFIIDAPAGAGKTELLTQRFLRLLACVDSPEEIIALTFTNKAAAEMRDRIISSLRSATCPPPPDALPHKRQTWELACDALQRDADCQWQLLKQPARLRIMTLDALAARIARQLPLLSRFGTQPAITSEPGRLYEQAARNTLDQLEDGTSASDTIAHVLAHFENDAGRLSKMLTNMLRRRDQWVAEAFGSAQSEPLRESISHTLAEMVRERLTEVESHFPARWQQGFMSAAAYAAKLSPDSPIHCLAHWDQPLTNHPADLPRWQALAELFLTQADKLRGRYQSPICIAGKEHAAQRQVLLDTIDGLEASGNAEKLASVRKLPEPVLDDDSADLITHLVALLRLAYAQLWLLFNQEKSVDFSEIAMRAVEALGTEDTPGELHERLDYRLCHLLVDEFQDTSPLQVSLLQRLTAGWAHDPGRTLFLVGDPMQSIYRFRKADVGLFLRVRQEGLGHIHLTPLQLYRNNRSHPEIVDWVNRTFDCVFGAIDDRVLGAVHYESCVAAKDPDPQSGVSIHPLIMGEPDADAEDTATGINPDELEARRIIDIIRATQTERPGATIAVLVRARPHLDALVDQLQSLASPIPFRAVEIDALAGRQAVQDLVILTRALHTPGDRLNWLAMLRAPWCGLTLADLHTLAADEHLETVWSLMQDDNRFAQLSEDGRRRLLPLRQILAVAMTNRHVQRPRRWVEGVWHALNGPATLECPKDVQDAEAYFALLDNLTRHGRLDLEGLDAALEKLFAAADNSTASEQVQLMTIHKAKGLQFDTVIIPGLHKTPPADEHALLLWDTLILDADGQEHLIVAPAPAPGANQPTATPYSYLRGLESSRSLNEDKRVLYVGATRAIRRLHLLGLAKRDSNEATPSGRSRLKTPPSHSLLAPLWPVLEDTFAAADSEPSSMGFAAGRMDPATFIPDLIRLNISAIAAPVSTGKLTTGSDQPSKVSKAGPRASTGFSNTLEMEIGTLVHHYLEAFARDGLAQWDTDRLNRLLPRMIRHFSGQGYATHDANEAGRAVHATLLKSLADPVSQWVLAAHEAAGCEVPLSSRLQSTPTDDTPSNTAHAAGEPLAQRHVIDRTFIENGIRWIIDYKTLHTDPALTGEALEAHLNDKAASYRPQLERYAALYAHEEARGLRVRMAVFFPAHGKLVPLSPENQK